LVSKLDAKYNGKATAQCKGQKNHILIEGSDNDTISPLIQSTNQSRVPSSRPRADVHPEGKDTRSNPEHIVERKGWVATPCSITMLYNPTGMW